MELTYNNERFEFNCTFNEKDIAKSNGFKWDMELKKWFTKDISIAEKLKEYANELCLHKLVKANERIEMSRAIDTHIELKKPQGLKFDYFNFQKAGIVFGINNKNVLIADDMGLGKEQPINTIIPTPNGFTTIGKLKKGDYVFSEKGLPTKVTGIFPQGIKEVYKVYFTDGTSTHCGLEHLWNVRDTNFKRDGWQTLSLKTILERGYIKENGKPKYKIPRQDCIEYKEKEFIVEPYILGLILGNGYIANKDVVLTINEFDYLEISKKINFEYNLRKKQGCFELNFRKEFKNLFRELNLKEKSRKKYIPKEYLLGSVKQRKELLSGLLDTDGSCVKNRTVYHTRSLDLAKDVKELVDSLGGFSTINEYYDKDYKCFDYQVQIELNFNPFTVNRKASEWKQKNFMRVRARNIEKIEKLEEKQESVCISVDNPTKLYLCERNYITTHNTVQAIGILNQLESFGTVLIVCPKTPMLNWRNEIKTWLIEDREIIVCNSKTDINNDNKIYIINYDILSKVNIDKVDVLIADEVHYAKNKTAQRSKTFYKIKTNRKIYLSGTPIMNRPSEIYHIVKSLDKNVFGTQFEFWKRYCDLKETKWGKDYSGASNLEELNYKLRSSVMIRRMKEEVLKDMPDKIRQVIKFEGNKKLIEQEMLLYSNAKNENFRPSSMADIIKLRQEIAIKKIPQILDYVNDTLENESKLIIFAHHKEVIETLERELSKEHQVVKIDGSVSQEDRQNAVDKFQKGTANIFLGSIRACSEAITLTASNHVIFAEIDWTPGKNIQAEDRAYRIGQKNTVNITYLVYENSVDEYILNTNITKEEVINKALE